jgi:hypothetical protein
LLVELAHRQARNTNKGGEVKTPTTSKIKKGIGLPAFEHRN